MLWNMIRRSLLLTPALALMAACASGGAGTPRPPATGSGAPSGNTTLRWSGQILAMGGSQVRGSAAATTIGSRTEVIVSITRGTAGGTHPWHVHRGTCGSGGPVVGSGGAYPPLQPDQAGNANETANLSVALSAGERYHVNVHESPQNPGSIVACAELSRS